MTVTKEDCTWGRIFHHNTQTNADGSCARYRANGRVKTQVRNVTYFRLPVKRGLYEYGYITDANAHLFHREDRCDRGREKAER